MALSAIVSLLQFPIFMLIKGPLQNDPLYVSTVLREGEGSRPSRLGRLRGAPAEGTPKPGSALTTAQLVSLV